MSNTLKLSKLIDFLSDDIIVVLGDRSFDYDIRSIKPTDLVDEFSLDWIRPTNIDKQTVAEQSPAKVIVCDSEIHYSQVLKNQNKIIIIVHNPKLSIAKVGEAFFADKYVPSIHPSADIDHEAIIGEGVFIGPHCTIGKCKIGVNTVIVANVVIHDSVTIGNNCLIQAGAVVGIEGLGCERLDDGCLVKFPHLGDVKIGDNVEIGVNTHIARGSLSSTIIADGTKINSLCYVAHNVRLGRHVLLSGHVMICGSAVIRDMVTLSPGATIRELVTVNEGSHVGLGSVVTKDIPPGEIWVGNPAKFLRYAK